MRKIIIILSVSLTFLAANFATFLYSYNSLTSSVFTEDQRIDNAAVIMSTTLPIYGFIALLFGVTFAYALKKRI